MPCFCCSHLSARVPNRYVCLVLIRFFSRAIRHSRTLHRCTLLFGCSENKVSNTPLLLVRPVHNFLIFWDRPVQIRNTLLPIPGRGWWCRQFIHRTKWMALRILLSFSCVWSYWPYNMVFGVRQCLRDSCFPVSLWLVFLPIQQGVWGRWCLIGIPVFSCLLVWSY